MFVRKGEWEAFVKRLLGTAKVSEKALYECSPLTKTSEKWKINQSNFTICDNLIKYSESVSWVHKYKYSLL